jgi:hypothetical protein
MNTIQKNQYEKAYLLALQVRDRKTRLTDAMDVLEKSGVKRNSGRDLIDAARHMLKGTVYKRAVSIATTDDFLTWIHRDYGKGALEVAITVVDAHIAYRGRGKGMPGYEDVVRKHRQMLNHDSLTDLSITKFFDQVLDAQLRNPQWAWGAHHLATNRIFLRVWQDELTQDQKGEQVVVLKKAASTSSPGYPERLRHLELIRAGAEAYGVLCTASDPKPDGKRQIKSFDQSVLLKLGALHDRGSMICADIDGRVPTGSLTRSDGLAADIAAVLGNKTIGKTTQEALVHARLGQGKFRADVLKLWGQKCAVTGIATLAAIRASHIKPWRTATNQERLDPKNGLPLVATLDALFDVGLITFDAQGRLEASRHLNKEDRGILLRECLRLRRVPNKDTAGYLEHHRAEIFLP